LEWKEVERKWDAGEAILACAKEVLQHSQMTYGSVLILVSYHVHTILLISNILVHAAKVVGNVIRSRSEKKIEYILGEDQFGFRKAIEMQLEC
jgi:hypothetical protein